MNCAWCSPSDNGTDGICDACMRLYFGVEPATIHAEIAAEEMQMVGRCGSRQAFCSITVLDRESLEHQGGYARIVLR
jgi:hypothetical protein